MCVSRHERQRLACAAPYGLDAAGRLLGQLPHSVIRDDLLEGRGEIISGELAHYDAAAGLVHIIFVRVSTVPSPPPGRWGQRACTACAVGEADGHAALMRRRHAPT